MVSRLVDEQEIIFPGKEHCQHHLRPLPMAQRTKGPVEDLRIKMQLLQLTDDPPLLTALFQLFQKFHGALRFLLLRDLIRKIVEYGRRAYMPLKFIFSQKKIQESSLAFAVPPDKSQFPIRIDLKRYLFKYIVKTALIAEGHVRHTDL